MSINVEDEALLYFFFGSDRLFWRSSMGAQLAAAEARSKGSDGRRFGAPTPWYWRPPDPRTQLQPDAPVYVPHGEGGEGGGYEVDPNLLLKHSRVSRRMQRICASDHRLERATEAQRGPARPGAPVVVVGDYTVLATYYGDAGTRWAQASNSRFEPDATGKDHLVYEGIGPGAIASLYRFTPAGRELLRLERLSSVRAKNGGTGPGKVARLRKQQIQQEIDRRLAVVERLNASLATQEAILAAPDPLSTDEHAAAAARRARRRAERLVVSLKETLLYARRDIELLRQHAARAPLAAPERDPSTPSVLEQIRALRHQHAADLRAWRSARASQAAALGLDPNSDDPRLPPRPAPPPLPSPPAARLPTYQTPSAEAQMPDDHVLTVALILQRKHPTAAYRVLLDRARQQATALLQRAWSAWQATAPAPTRSRLPRPPNAILVHRVSPDAPLRKAAT